MWGWHINKKKEKKKKEQFSLFGDQSENHAVIGLRRSRHFWHPSDWLQPMQAKGHFQLPARWCSVGAVAASWSQPECQQLVFCYHINRSRSTSSCSVRLHGATGRKWGKKKWRFAKVSWMKRWSRMLWQLFVVWLWKVQNICAIVQVGSGWVKGTASTTAQPKIGLVFFSFVPYFTF